MRLAREPAVESLFYPYDSEWRQVSEPDGDVAQVCALAAGAILCLAALVCWLLFAPFRPVRVDYVTIAAALAIVVVVHELTHAVAFTCGRRRSLRVELHWRKYTPQLRYQGAVSRTHYVVVLAAPFVVVSLGAVAFSALLSIGSGDLVLISLLNALVSGADLVAATLVLGQVPAEALVRRHGDLVLWKPRTSASTVSPSTQSIAREKVR